ncbi:hypothetical protein F5Y17DRAFT_419899 [Xylariaceae sp. FL0594]|nr:hypothetical protein F5Y17DRAFT_419899 [Xylariaceae sp. FL0594]
MKLQIRRSVLRIYLTIWPSLSLPLPLSTLYDDQNPYTVPILRRPPLPLFILLVPLCIRVPPHCSSSFLLYLPCHPSAIICMYVSTGYMHGNKGDLKVRLGRARVQHEGGGLAFSLWFHLPLSFDAALSEWLAAK